MSLHMLSSTKLIYHRNTSHNTKDRDRDRDRDRETERQRDRETETEEDHKSNLKRWFEFEGRRVCVFVVSLWFYFGHHKRKRKVSKQKTRIEITPSFNRSSAGGRFSQFRGLALHFQSHTRAILSLCIGL